MAYRASSAVTTSNSASSSTSVNAPVGVQAGDIVVIVILSRGVTGVTYTWPSGFTEAAVNSRNGSLAHSDTYAVATKVATGSEPASYSVTQSSALSALMVCAAWTGRSSTPVTFATTTNPGGFATSGSIALNGGTAASGDDIAWIGMLSQNSVAWTISNPSGYSSAANISTAGNNDQIQLSYKDAVSSGATGTISGTATESGSTGADPFGIVIALSAAASATLDPITVIFPLADEEE